LLLLLLLLLLLKACGPRIAHEDVGGLVHL